MASSKSRKSRTAEIQFSNRKVDGGGGGGRGEGAVDIFMRSI